MQRMIFDGHVHQLPDIDPVETEEWLDSLDAVVDVHGKTRARYLLSRLMERANGPVRSSFPATVSTPYVNTIPRDEEPWFPGDEHIERRIRAFIRWNAARWSSRPTSRRRHRRPPLDVCVSAACTRSASTTSSAAKTTAHPGDHVYFQGHAAPGVYARAFLEGRLTDDDLDHFRRELGRGGAALSRTPTRV